MPSLRTELSKTREEEKREREIISEKKKFVVNGKKFSSNDSVSHHHYSSNGGKSKKSGFNNSFVVAIKPQEKEKIKTKTKTKTKTKKKTEKEKENSKRKAKCCEKSSAPGNDISKDIDDAKRIEKFFLNHTYYNTIIIKDHPIPLSPSETDSSNYSFTTMESSSHSSSISKRSSNRRTNTNHHHTTNEDADDLNPTQIMVLRASKVDTNEIPTRNELGPRDIEHQGLRISPLQRKPSELETNLVILHNEGIRDNNHNNDEDVSDSCISDSNVHCHDDIRNTPNMSKIVGFLNFHNGNNASHDDAKESSQARLLSIDYIGMPSLTASKCDSDPQSMRSKSEGGGLRSAVRNLEAAFIGSQVPVSASQKGLKSRQKQVKHLNSESSKVSLDRGFLVSPVRSRNKQHENLRSILRAPHEFRGSKLHLRRNPSYIGVIPPLPLRIHNTTKSGMEKDIISCRQAMSQGYLQRITRSDGLPSCYTLTINDSDDMLLARPCEPGDGPSKENYHQSTYTFHGAKIAPTTRVAANGWKSWIRKDCHDKSLTNLAGEMKVLSKIHCESGTFPGNNNYEMVSEFTLFDGGARIDVARSQSSRFLSSEDHKVYSTITLESNRNTSSSSSSSSSLSSQRRSSTSHLQRYLASSARWSSSNAIFKGPFTVRHNASFNTWDDSDRTQSEMNHLFPPSNPLHNTCNNNNLELSAVVIKAPIHLNPLKGDGVWERSHSSVSSSQCSDEIACNDKEPCTIGYLQQSSAMQPSESCEESSSPRITMILPSQRHGLPNHGTRGPTSLIERWKSGGKCDCGGWDLGCGMMVCCNGRHCTTLSSNPSSCLDQNKSLRIYSQGRSQEVVLSLLLVQDGFFIVQFHEQLMSPLKAFATSVAVLHNEELLASATHTMMVNMKHLIETLDCDGKAEKQTRPRDLSISSDETDSLEACKDISVMWCPPYPPSPFGRA